MQYASLAHEGMDARACRPYYKLQAIYATHIIK